MTYQYQSEYFAGPMEVLWEMMQKEDFEISKISLANVTDQYLEYIKENEEALSSDDLSEFLKIATLLLKMKIRYITKSWQKWEDEDDDDQADLLWQLKLYDKYHKQVLKLNRVFDFSTIKMYGKRKQKTVNKNQQELKIMNLNIEVIQTLAFELMGNWRDRFKKWQVSKFKLLNVKEKIFALNERLNQIANMSFDEMRKELPKGEIIANFLAILELIKRQEINVQQKNNFADLLIEKS